MGDLPSTWVLGHPTTYDPPNIVGVSRWTGYFQLTIWEPRGFPHIGAGRLVCFCSRYSPTTWGTSCRGSLILVMPVSGLHIDWDQLKNVATPYIIHANGNIGVGFFFWCVSSNCSLILELCVYRSWLWMTILSTALWRDVCLTTLVADQRCWIQVRSAWMSLQRKDPVSSRSYSWIYACPRCVIDLRPTHYKEQMKKVAFVTSSVTNSCLNLAVHWIATE